MSTGRVSGRSDLCRQILRTDRMLLCLKGEYEANHSALMATCVY